MLSALHWEVRKTFSMIIVDIILSDGVVAQFHCLFTFFSHKNQWKMEMRSQSQSATASRFQK